MLRIPVKCRKVSPNCLWPRLLSSDVVRSTFITYFKENHGHKFVKSSAVVPLCDPTVPFVNAGMNQFKGVFLGNVERPCPRAVNSQKCIRVGGKHNDLDVVGTDGHHHTFFEMLGSWSFGDYYKKEACQMAWDLLLGPYRLKPEQLLVTYFSGDAVIGLKEDTECRDIWKAIGVPPSHLKALGAKDNFWEMGATGPCGPCSEIHYINPDGSLTEIWNLVFIQCNRVSDTAVTRLKTHHVDTGMGLERVTALLQGVPSNYDTDLFQPIIKAIGQKSKGVDPYKGQYGEAAKLDAAYRRLADHARMVAVCLADGVFPATSVNLKQILRKSFKISSEVFQCDAGMMSHLYNAVAETLQSAYPELHTKAKQAKLIIAHEEDAYKKLKSNLRKKWKDLVKAYPEVEGMSDVELPGFPLGYKELKETMSKQKTTLIPGDLVFKLYDTHGFQEDLISRVAKLNSLEIDKKSFWRLLQQHKFRHKTAFKEQTDRRGLMFNEAIENLTKAGIRGTDDKFKYNYKIIDNKIHFEPLRTNLVAILNDEAEWIDFSEPCEHKPYYLVTKDSNFYCEEGGQIADSGVIVIDNIKFTVESVFKIRDFIFYKGIFKLANSGANYINTKMQCDLHIDSEKRLNTMIHHTATHLLNAALRKALPDSAVCQIGSKVTDKELVLNLTVYGKKITQDVVLEVQEVIRNTIKQNVPLRTSVIDSVQLSNSLSVLTVPGETYPEVGLRLVEADSEALVSKELCCGTHLPSTGFVEDFCVTLVKGAGSNAPIVHAIAGRTAKEARELFCRAEKLEHVIEIIDQERLKQETVNINNALASICGTSGTPYGEYAECLAKLDKLGKQTRDNSDLSLEAIAMAEVQTAKESVMAERKRALVYFVRSSYLWGAAPLAKILPRGTPALLLGCANGILHVACTVPTTMLTSSFTAEKWLSSVLPVFKAQMAPPVDGQSTDIVAEMVGTKVSLITCEQLVQDAMEAANEYVNQHGQHLDISFNDKHTDDLATQTRSSN